MRISRALVGVAAGVEPTGILTYERADDRSVNTKLQRRELARASLRSLPRKGSGPPYHAEPELEVAGDSRLIGVPIIIGKSLQVEIIYTQSRGNIHKYSDKKYCSNADALVKWHLHLKHDRGR